MKFEAEIKKIDSTIESLGKKSDKLQDMMGNIYEKADYYDRDLTESEEAKYELYENMQNEIEDALRLLNDALIKLDEMETEL